MSRDDFRTIVAEILEEEPENLQPDTRLEDLETYDSVNALSLIIALDEEAGVKVMPDELMALETYGDIEALAEKRGCSFD